MFPFCFSEDVVPDTQKQVHVKTLGDLWIATLCIWHKIQIWAQYVFETFFKHLEELVTEKVEINYANLNRIRIFLKNCLGPALRDVLWQADLKEKFEIEENALDFLGLHLNGLRLFSRLCKWQEVFLKWWWKDSLVLLVAVWVNHKKAGHDLFVSDFCKNIINICLIQRLS